MFSPAPWKYSCILPPRNLYAPRSILPVHAACLLTQTWPPPPPPSPPRIITEIPLLLLRSAQRVHLETREKPLGCPTAWLPHRGKALLCSWRWPRLTSFLPKLLLWVPQCLLAGLEEAGGRGAAKLLTPITHTLARESCKFRACQKVMKTQQFSTCL